MRRALRIAVATVVLSVVSCGILATFHWFHRPSESDALNDVLPALIPSPTLAQQTQLLVAMKAHPNPPLIIDPMLPVGADARGLTTLFGAMESPITLQDGAIRRRAVLASGPTQGLDTTFLAVDVAGDPPRVIRRYVETYFDPAY